MERNAVQATRAALVLLAGTTLSACGGESGPAGPSQPLVNAPYDVVDDLRNAWNRRDQAALAKLLTGDFVFYVSAADAESAGVPFSWDREMELTSVKHLFEGETGVGPDGTPQPPVDPRFTFGLTIVPDEEDWTPRDDPPFEGALSRRFLSSMTAQYANLDLDFIAGSQVLFVREGPGTDESGAPVRRYRLAAWQDLGQIPALRHQALTWGFLKALYRQIYTPEGRRDRPTGAAGSRGPILPTGPSHPNGSRMASERGFDEQITP